MGFEEIAESGRYVGLASLTAGKMGKIYVVGVAPELKK